MNKTKQKFWAWLSFPTYKNPLKSKKWKLLVPFLETYMAVKYFFTKSLFNFTLTTLIFYDDFPFICHGISENYKTFLNFYPFWFNLCGPIILHWQRGFFWSYCTVMHSLHRIWWNGRSVLKNMSFSGNWKRDSEFQNNFNYVHFFFGLCQTWWNTEPLFDFFISSLPLYFTISDIVHRIWKILMIWRC